MGHSVKMVKTLFLTCLEFVCDHVEWVDSWAEVPWGMLGQRDNVFAKTMDERYLVNNKTEDTNSQTWSLPIAVLRRLVEAWPEVEVIERRCSHLNLNHAILYQENVAKVQPLLFLRHLVRYFPSLHTCHGI